MATLSKACGHDRSNIEIMVSNPTRALDMSLRFTVLRFPLPHKEFCQIHRFRNISELEKAIRLIRNSEGSAAGGSEVLS